MFKLVTEYPGSFKLGAEAKAEGESFHDFYFIYFNGVKVGTLNKDEVENNKFWKPLHNFKVNDKVYKEGTVETVMSIGTYQIQLGKTWFDTTEFSFYGIRPVNEETEKIIDSLRKYERLLNASHWMFMRKENPAVYWRQMMFLMADDMNGAWTPDWTNDEQPKWVIAQKKGVLIEPVTTDVLHYGTAVFYNEASAELAMQIVGNNINYLFVDKCI